MNDPSVLQPDQFAAFFKAVYGFEPFPWQERLVKRVCAGDWPKVIAVPTAGGKTACIDIAVFALACQADRPSQVRAAPRRIFFVVDRRVVVDQAYGHARQLAELLRGATAGVLQGVADALRRIGHQDDRPLDVYALRGGMYRETAWVRSPLQPTVITSTVDQVGSRLLFRGYGVSDLMRPIHAGLVGNDALILLDEAHCARPFDQTMAAVTKYRSWTKEALPPFRFVSITATPSTEVPEVLILRDDDRDCEHPVLGLRIKAAKPARLVVAEKATGSKWRRELVAELARQARSLMGSTLDRNDNPQTVRAVGIIVNRVATARQLAEVLRAPPDGKAPAKPPPNVILLTGRMRPVDRDAVLRKLEPLFAGRNGEMAPTFVVATQCLEVGADLDFHALVTECASLDALRQRFGRLNRIGARPAARAVVVIRGDQTEPVEAQGDQDAVYGNSLANTWRWLKQKAVKGIFDFGVAAMKVASQSLTAEEMAALNAPAADAPVLLPAYLDCWVQTSPTPAPDPDIAVFLHGPTRGIPDVQVVFRADLGDSPDLWPEIVSFCPPSSAEALVVRIDVFRRWLGDELATDESGDIEGEAGADDQELSPTDRNVLRWSGPDSDRTTVISDPWEVRPGDLFVLPVSAPDVAQLGDFPTLPPTDLGDAAFQRSRDKAILRLVKPPLPGMPDPGDLTIQAEDLDERLSGMIASVPVQDLPEGHWLKGAVKHLSKPANRRVFDHPMGGLVVEGRKRLRLFDPTFIEAEESTEASTGQPIYLAAHHRDVAGYSKRFAQALGLREGIVRVLCDAGFLHDAGKADPRFQAWLHGGDWRKAAFAAQPFAKSIVLMPDQASRQCARQRAGYPQGARHELVSVRLAESDGVLPDDPLLHDLALHLIASHHGYCRPFAPVVADESPVKVVYDHNGHMVAASSATGLEGLDSGVAERFWMLTRRFGWWGLPWLELTLRLADWAASQDASTQEAGA